MEGERALENPLFLSFFLSFFLFLTLVFVIILRNFRAKKIFARHTSDQFAHWHKTANQIASSEPFFVGFSPYNTLVVGAQPAVSRFLFRQAVFCAATVRSIISLYKLVAAVNSRIFIATLSFAAKAFSILNKGPNHLKSKLWNFNPILFLKLLSLIFQHFLLIKLHIRSDEGKR